MVEEQEMERFALPSGYEYDFVSAVLDEYHCLICHLPLRGPVQTRCGHRYCKECLHEAIRRQPFPECPADREALDLEKEPNPDPDEMLLKILLWDFYQDIFPDKATERNILSCHVRCPSEGCKWIGETRDVKTHLQTCDQKVIPCPNNNCHMKMERRRLEDHTLNKCQWRLVCCVHCGEQNAKCNEEKHASVCQRFPTDCSSGCGEVVAREEIGNHIQNGCPLTIISCPYLHMGCKTKVQRKKMESHLQSATGVHLDLACVKLNNTQAQLDKTQVQLHDAQDQLDSTEVQLSSTRVRLKSTEETTRELVEKVEALQRQLKEALNDRKRNKAIESVVMDMKKKKNFTWKIDNFSRLLRQSKAGGADEIESVPFYAENCGYKFKVSLSPNGNGSGVNTHLSVFIEVMRGEYDAILEWPLTKTVRFRLIDQQLQAENVEKSFTYVIHDRPKVDRNNTNARGSPEFISHEKLKTRRYLVDDTMFLQVTVGPLSSSVKSWSTSSLQTAVTATTAQLK